MKRSLLILLLLSFLMLIIEISPASSEAKKGSYLVVLQDSVQAPRRVAHDQIDRWGSKLGFVYRHALTGYSAELPDQALDELRDDPRIRYVIEDGYVEPSEEIEIDTDDNEWVEPEAAVIPTGISRTFAASNNALDIDGQDDVRADVDVAILDSGIDPSHPDLNVVNRVDCTQGGEFCVANSGTPGDHGTHVAGIAGALDNGFGVVGMAPGARLWSVKVLGASGGQWSWVIAGIDWVAAHSSQIEVANMSLGGSAIVFLIEELLDQAREEGVVYVVAAGNQNMDVKERTPSNVLSAITVSAIADYDGLPGGKAAPTCANYGLDDQRANFSNWGAGVDIASPGVCIASTEPGNKYGMKSGTSMATPYVAGAAALLAAKKNPESKADVESIRNSLVSKGNLEWVDTSGDKIKERLLDVHDESAFSLVAPPTLTTGDVSFSGIGSETQTTVDGTVTPNGLNTTYWFEYASAAQYEPGAGNPYAKGTKAPIAPAAIGSGEKGEPLQVKQVLTGLEPSTTYHYRLVAENSKGTSKGGDREFVSPAACKGAEAKCAWSLQSTPNPQPETISVLEDVACPSSSSCLAVGTDRYRSKGISQYWNGSEWKAAVSVGTELKRVSCPTTTWCMATGSEGKAWQLSLAEGSWSQSSKTPPAPEGATSVGLSDVSCTSSSACTVVGVYTAGSSKPYVARWNGSSWSLQSAPSPSEGTASEAMLSVSCSSATHCVTVGKAAKKPFVERWNGSEWAIQSAPNPEGATDANLQSVSCTSESACMAVGYYQGKSGVPQALSQRWNGSSWATVASPAPSEEGGVLMRSISCLSASSCVAVGRLFYPYPSITAEETVVHDWDGAKWTLRTSINPDTFSSLAGVSCSSTTACTAVGKAGSAWLGETETLAERWS